MLSLGDFYNFFFTSDSVNSNTGPMMPIGIQMFATITSKDHARNIQQDLQNIYFTDAYRDTILQVGICKKNTGLYSL